MDEDLKQPQSDKDFYQLWKVDKLSQLQHMKAICMLTAGYTPKQVAENIGITQRALQKWFNDNEFKETLTYAIGINVKESLASASVFTLDCVKILKEIAENPDTPYRYKIDAIKTIFDILHKSNSLKTDDKQTKQIKQLKPQNQSADLEKKEFDKKELELKKAQEYINCQKRLKTLTENIEDDLHLLPNNHPLYKPKPSPEIQQYRNVWKLLKKNEPYPDEAELKAFYDKKTQKALDSHH